jgi:hypothetical protein
LIIVRLPLSAARQAAGRDAVGMSQPIGLGAQLFERLPETLVIEGFRQWMAGCASGDACHWDNVCDLYAARLGAHGTRPLIHRLAHFVQAVRDWSLSPVSCFPLGCQRIGRQECFALAMVAAAQKPDGECLAAAAEHLIVPEAHEAVTAEARRYAGALRERRLLLMDVPRRVVDHVAGRPQHLRLH